MTQCIGCWTTMPERTHHQHVRLHRHHAAEGRMQFLTLRCVQAQDVVQQVQ